MGYQAQPLRRNQLRHLARRIREILSLDDVLRFPIVLFLEQAMPLLFEGFYIEIVEKDAFPIQKHAETDVINRCIRIREDIYYGAVADRGRDRMTVAHEVAHYILLVVCGVKFDRVFDGAIVKTYCDPEWQAKALAGELMCPNHLIGGLSPQEVMDMCGVSEQAAKFNLSICKGGGVY